MTHLSSFSQWAPNRTTPHVGGFKLPPIRNRGAKPDTNPKITNHVHTIFWKDRELPLKHNSFALTSERTRITRCEIEVAKEQGIFDKKSYQGPTHVLSPAAYPRFSRKLSLDGRPVSTTVGTLYLSPRSYDIHSKEAARRLGSK